MTAELFVALLVLAVFGWLIWKGSKQIRGIVAFLLIYGILRVLEVLLFGNNFNDFVRTIFLGAAEALSNLANPDIGALAPLIVTVVIIVALALLIRSENKLLRAVAGFTIIYIVIRIFDAVALGNGFNGFVGTIADGLADAFGTGAANMP